MTVQDLKVGIQGVKASFHDVAARSFFKNDLVKPIECSTFKKLCEVLQSGEADVCAMAIENSIAGSILTNYSLLERYRFKILGETYLRIELSLMALPGQKTTKLQFVQSHPMALLQCEEFLNNHSHLKILESPDTAESAKVISKKGLTMHGAIASHLAAETYGLQILHEGIETNKQNYTRFLFICNEKGYKPSPQANKASLRFQLPHRPGSLVDVLQAFKKHSVNMTKIQSVPVLGQPYEYGFHVDLEWTNKGDYESAMATINSSVHSLVHFGEYEKGERSQTL